MLHKITTCLLFSFITTIAFSQSKGSTGMLQQKVLPYEPNLILGVWPPQVTPLCTRVYKIVVVGSSTAYGTGATPIDSSWARKFRFYLLVQNSAIQVINIATLGLTSWDVSPTGTVVPPPFTVDIDRNITKALSFNPDAIILNLPSNDVARGISTANIHQNFMNIVGAATAQNVPVWVTTTQPRNGLSPAEGVLQAELRDWINLTYGNKSVDFWTDIANPDNTINTFYSAGDGVHLNNEGHHVLFTRMVEEKIWDTICRRNDMPPVARAGNDTAIATTSLPIILNGSFSTDPDGSITAYNWMKISGSPNGGTLTNANSALATASSFSVGVYKYQLTVTDNIGISSKDTMIVNVSTVLALDDLDNPASSTRENKYLKIFPNPASDFINIKIPKVFSNDYSITLSNSLGSIVFRKFVVKNNGNNIEVIDIKELASGMYILQFLSKEKKIIHKIIKF
jgi:lysophospholipase L1-like esterase